MHDCLYSMHALLRIVSRFCFVYLMDRSTATCIIIIEIHCLLQILIMFPKLYVTGSIEKQPTWQKSYIIKLCIILSLWLKLRKKLMLNGKWPGSN